MSGDARKGLDRREMMAISGGAIGSILASKVLAAEPIPAAAPGRQVWYPNYQERDGQFIDYQEFEVRGCDVKFRGPGLDPFAAEPGSFFSCLGAAQTYGCFVPKPYPTLLAEAIGLPALNLAVGGAGPGFAMQYNSLIEAINRGRFLILQCMAARHESNSRFAADGYVEFVKDRKTGEQINSGVAWRRIMQEDPKNALRYVAETRLSWIETSRRLLDHIKVPVMFFWYSRRKPEYTIDRTKITEQLAALAKGTDQSHFIDGLSGDFPHFVDDWTSSAVADMCHSYVECLSSRGMGQPIINQFTGKPIVPVAQPANVRNGTKPEWSAAADGINHYYPSPEMHADACAALFPIVNGLSG